MGVNMDGFSAEQATVRASVEAAWENGIATTCNSLDANHITKALRSAAGRLGTTPPRLGSFLVVILRFASCGAERAAVVQKDWAPDALCNQLICKLVLSALVDLPGEPCSVVG